MSGDPGQHGVDPDAVPDVIRGHGEGEGGHRTLPGGVQGGRTRTTRQGQGLGSALVEMGTSRADAAGVPCYLETAMDLILSENSRVETIDKRHAANAPP